MTISFSVGEEEFTLSNNNAVWLGASLAIPIEGVTTLLPSQVLAACDTFYAKTTGDYETDPNLVARIMELLPPVQSEATKKVLEQITGTVQPISPTQDWGVLSDPNSLASRRWSLLQFYVGLLRDLANDAQQQGEIIHLY